MFYEKVYDSDGTAIAIGERNTCTKYCKRYCCRL